MEKCAANWKIFFLNEFHPHFKIEFLFWNNLLAPNNANSFIGQPRIDHTIINA